MSIRSRLSTTRRGTGPTLTILSGKADLPLNKLQPGPYRSVELLTFAVDASHGRGFGLKTVCEHFAGVIMLLGNPTVTIQTSCVSLFCLQDYTSPVSTIFLQSCKAPACSVSYRLDLKCACSVASLKKSSCYSYRTNLLLFQEVAMMAFRCSDTSSESVLAVL